MNRAVEKTPIPKYRQLVERYQSQIESGELQPGDRLPSLKEMSAQQGLSRPTVEKAYAFLEREGLIEKLHGAGVFVRQPRSRSTQGVIGLSGDGFNFAGNSHYWGQILGGAREAAANAGVQLLILDSASYDGWEKADGVLVCDWDDKRKPRKKLPGLPIVSLMTPIPGTASVVADDHGATYSATEHLIQLGHRRIGFLHGYENALMRNRISGYQKALQDNGIRARKDWMRCLRGHYDVGARFTTEARKNMLLWLRDGWNELGCTALLCHNDETATGVIETLTQAGFRVPEDVSVFGFDGTEYCELVRPRLSSVEIPLREIGAAGVELLLQQIEAERLFDTHRVLPTRLQMRETTLAAPHS
jgi:DNA-binding LacI/PurR family transcriptional regulator